MTLDPWPLKDKELLVRCEGVRIPSRGRRDERPREALGKGTLVPVAFLLRPV